MLKEIAEKKARKQAKAERQMVVIQPRNYSNGRLVRDGKVFDIAGNVVAKVNRKNGKINLAGFGGWGLGRYKPGVFSDAVIQDAINKYSPYYINLRKMQAMQQGQHGVWGPGVGGHGQDVMVYSPSQAQHTGGDSGNITTYGSDFSGPRQNIGVTGWGAMSDNVWGTYADNAWGRSMDNVWGTNSSDVWGGIGGNPFGHMAKTVQFWGTGNGHNFLKGLTGHLMALFGMRVKNKTSAAVHEVLRNSRSAAHETRTAAHEHMSTRSGGNSAPATRAPATTRH